jgi:hypothetical protein
MTEFEKEIREYRRESSNYFERQIVYISGGAIALCIGILQAENTIISHYNMSAFLLALVSFSTTLLLNLMSHLTSIKTMDLALEEKEEASDKWNTITNWINRVSIASLALGLISIVITVIQIKQP